MENVQGFSSSKIKKKKLHWKSVYFCYGQMLDYGPK